MAKTGIYLTYIGPGGIGVEGRAKSIEKDCIKFMELEEPRVLPVLDDIPTGSGFVMEGRTPFSSILPGCGLIELGVYGVQPFPGPGKC